ncbi:LytR/AlgR family response regulator transcription factor [Dyadobacter tibetensis]|uniref:LytR/AlgR family response regulator transcription factor n=1 Tax=Dyadobacter tibetensis TaxID=1211851 RepID=UPI0004719912|nr:LytTR family DNA-binding domain-containing protein [Dyadobacter tibetensis]
MYSLNPHKLYPIAPIVPRSSHYVEYFQNGRMLEIYAKDITYLKGEGNYTLVYTTNGNQYLISKTIKFLRRRLTDHFVRVHKSFLVNANHVISWPEPYKLMLADGRQVPVARRRLKYTQIGLRNSNTEKSSI